MFVRVLFLAPESAHREREKQLTAAAFLVFILVSSLQNPALADIYTEHAHQVVVAKYAPSGFYIASGGTCVCACLGCGGVAQEFPSPPGLLAAGWWEEGQGKCKGRGV